MANKKRIFTVWEINKTIYAIVERELDNFLLDANDGSFVLTPVNKFNVVVADISQTTYYKLDESRTIWNDGNYNINIYLQVGGTPNLTTDILIDSGVFRITDFLDSGEFNRSLTIFGVWNFSNKIVSGLENIITGISTNDNLTLTNTDTFVEIVSKDTPTLIINTGRDLTGQTVTMIVKRNIDDSDANALVNRPVTIDDITNGVVSITLTNIETGFNGNMFAELVSDNGAGVILTLVQFRLNILRRVKD